MFEGKILYVEIYTEIILLIQLDFRHLTCSCPF